MQCVKCSSQVKTERDKCPKCDAFTVISLGGKVKGQPQVTKNEAGEHYVHFQVLTDDCEVACEIKQGYENESPLQADDEIKLEGRLFLEGRKKSFRVTKLLNKTGQKSLTYSTGGCFPGLVGLIMVTLIYAMIGW
ncbi:MAG: hypothetical protein ACYDG6_08435 [Thermincolia bacterium]